MNCKIFPLTHDYVALEKAINTFMATGITVTNMKYATTTKVYKGKSGMVLDHLYSVVLFYVQAEEKTEVVEVREGVGASRGKGI